MNKLDEYAHTQNQRRKLFKECFSTPAGEAVLKDLQEEFYDCSIDPGTNSEYNLGRRDVIWQILELIKRSTA